MLQIAIFRIWITNIWSVNLPRYRQTNSTYYNESF